MRQSWDYIIVGAGSAGCVLANRLSANPDVSVLLLEAGGRDWNPFIHIPAGLAKLVGIDHLNWSYETEPEPQLCNRRLYWPRGRVLGGSSSLNAMCYTRGHRLDYDEWAQLGAEGWDYASVLPYFRRAERFEAGGDDYHGDQGPLWVSQLRHVNPLSRTFLEATAQAGLPRNDDFNGPVQEGFGLYHVTQKEGRRCSTAVGYLRPATDRSNLTVLTGALATRVVMERARARGVEFRRRGRLHTARVSGEVLLAGGALNSPQLLMLSGIGPAQHLRSHGIEVAHDSVGVGQNLQDHLDVCTLYRCTQPITYDKLNELAVGLRYLLRRDGPASSNVAEAGGFARSGRDPEDVRPDLQFHFVPALLDDHGRNQIDGHGFTIHACDLRPESVGEIRLRSADPAAAPRIFANYLSAGDDLNVMLEGVRMAREIIAQRAFEPFRGAEIFPGDEASDRESLVSFIRRKAETIYHPIGTCRMGADAEAVVDPQLRVKGVEGIRVIDASVMPKLVSGNTNAPTIMIAERASDLLLGV